MNQNEIQAVLIRYADAINRRDWATLPSLFADSSSWEFAPGGRVNFAGQSFSGSADVVAKGIRSVVEPTDLLFQVHAPALIETRGNTASARSSMREICELKAQNVRIETHGMYADELTSAAGQWRFVSRRFTIFDIRFTKIVD